MKEKIKLLAFDLDGTVTQHKSPIEKENFELFTSLSKKYKLLMVGAGGCERIFNQLGKFPIDIIGNYGLQFAEYNYEKDELEVKRDVVLPVDKESIDKRASELRECFGFTEFSGDSVEYHPSGCITIAILGTKAKLSDKLAFDPDRSRRRAIHDEVKAAFPEYTVFIGGTSSFDMAPAPYDKAYALSEYCKEHGISHHEVVYFGDDFGKGGNDESVYLSDFNFVKISDYRALPDKAAFLL